MSKTDKEILKSLIIGIMKEINEDRYYTGKRWLKFKPDKDIQDK